MLNVLQVCLLMAFEEPLRGGRCWTDAHGTATAVGNRHQKAIGQDASQLHPVLRKIVACKLNAVGTCLIWLNRYFAAVSVSDDGAFLEKRCRGNVVKCSEQVDFEICLPFRRRKDIIQWLDAVHGHLFQERKIAIKRIMNGLPSLSVQGRQVDFIAESS